MVDILMANGFIGFTKVEKLATEVNNIVDLPGVYIVLYMSNLKPNFILKGTGGFFKNKNPNVKIEILDDNWVTNANIVYIGKATSLQVRIKQFIYFGQGRNIGHYGGRYIWQIEKSNELLFCWKIFDNINPRDFEKKLINQFQQKYYKKPFANLKSK